MGGKVPKIPLAVRNHALTRTDLAGRVARDSGRREDREVKQEEETLHPSLFSAPN